MIKMEIWKNKSLSDLKGEVWRSVIGYENTHMVSNLGRVKALEKYKISGCIKKPILWKSRILHLEMSQNGYLKMTIQHNKIKRYTHAHRLVAEAFILNPQNKPQVNHIDGDKTNNNVNNLEWSTGTENQLHAFEIGLRHKKFGEVHHNSKVSDKDALKIIKLYNGHELKGRGKLSRMLGEKYGVPWHHIQAIALGFRRSYLQ